MNLKTRSEVKFITLLILCFLMLFSTRSQAQVGGVVHLDKTRWVSIGAGLRTSFKAVEDAAPSGSSFSKEFDVESIRLYLNGQVFKGVTFEFNTERDSSDTGDMRVLDAIAKFNFNPHLHIWAGRFLPPADRSNSVGPFFQNAWDLLFVQAYPAIFAGRDDGVALWGTTLGEKLKYQFGFFDGTNSSTTTSATTSNQDDHLLYAGRLVYNFWDPEAHYYSQSTYFGKLDILAIGISATFQQDGAGTATQPEDYNYFSVDFMMEKKLAQNGVITLDGAYYDYDLNGAAANDTRSLKSGQSWFLLGGYLFPKKYGWGRVQPVIRYQKFDQDLIGDHIRYDIGLNYIIDGHNAKISLNYSLDDDPGRDIHDVDRFTLGLQLQIF